MPRKTDNSSPAAKLALRRMFLKKYHADDPPDVLDCCQGEGRIWKQLRLDGFEVASYWGVDLKPQRGRLRIDSIKILSQRGWTQNVIDIDTYGSPWKHYLAMLPRVKHPVTVFLTIGVGGPGRIRVGREELDAMGLPDGVKSMSGAITHPLLDHAIHCSLTRAYAYGLEIVEALEVYEPPLSKWRTRYYGVRLEPVP